MWTSQRLGSLRGVHATDNKQLLDEVFVISGIIKVEVSVISRSRRLRLITLAETLIIPDITKTESNNCFIIHCFEENNDKRIIAAITVYFQTLKNVQLSDKQIFTVFIKQSSAEKLNAFLKIVPLNLYLQVISQFLAGSMKRELDIALGNHALRAQPTDYSLICRYRLVNNL